MKTILLSLTFALITMFASGQQTCQPNFSYQGGSGTYYFFGYVDSLNTPMDSVNSWTWSFAGGGANYTATGQNPVIQLTDNLVYVVCLSITTQSGCSGTFCDSVIIDNCNLNVIIQQTQPTQGSCDGSISATASGGTLPYTYFWNTGQTTNQISNLCPGTYTLNVTDAGGCSESATATLFTPGQNCQPYFSYQSSGGVTYFYGYVDSINTPIDSVNSWTWTFTGGGANYTSALQNPVMQLTSNTLYNVCVSITTFGGCSGSFCDSVYLGTPCTLVVTTTSTQPTTGQCDGTITAVASGGTPPYVYLWSIGATTSTITDLCIGTYNLTVTDADGCLSYAYVVLNDTTNQNCNAMFLFDVNPNGIIQFYDSSWAANGIAAWSWMITDSNQNILFTSTDQNPAAAINTTGYIYVTLTITSTNGLSCTYTSMIYIQGTSPCTFTAYMDITQISVIGGNDGAIDLTVTGGIPPYTFLWSTGQISEDISGLYSGNYTVMILDNDSACQGISLTGYIYEPYDTTGGNIIIDTLTAPILDTCLNFVPDSFYISQIDIINNTSVLVTWTFVGAGQIQTLQVEYQFTANGNYLVVLTINCNGSKEMTTYSSYIHIHTILTSAFASVKPELSLFPNPATTSFNIEAMPPYNYTITSLSGQIICTSHSEINRSSVNTSGLPSGIYFVKVESNGSINVAKVIICK